MSGDRTTVARGGMSVAIAWEDTDEGPILKLEPQNCSLEGVAPGEYLLVPDDEPEAAP